jgi:hypothetical protein
MVKRFDINPGILWPLTIMGLLVLALTSPLSATHPNIFLYDKEFEEINPILEEDIDRPFSIKVTCGLCHDYDVITSGYHFQQGWDVISDTFGLAHGHPWVLSDGMMGKW